MIKVLNQYFPGRLFVLLVTENLLIVAAIVLVVSLRLGGADVSVLTYPVLIGKVLFITMICQGCFYYADIYDLRKIGSKMEMFTRLLQALGAASLVLAFLFYSFPGLRMGGGIVELSIFAIILIILTWRLAVERLNISYGAGERVLLVGSGATVHQLAREMRNRTDLPLEIIGLVIEDALAGQPSLDGLVELGPLSKLEEIVAEHKPKRLIVALKERRQQLPLPYLLRLRMQGTIIEEASTLYQKLTGKVPVESIHPSSLIFSDGFRQSAFARAYGRLSGLVMAALALILLGPIMLLVAVLIKLDSRGPVFYGQERVGKNGKPFRILKFRSMRADAESLSGPVWAQEKDPRITRMGAFMRKTRLDELPQFINVLRGEMSFVGPRPERPFFVEMLAKQITFFELRHYVRPGITGWAQVSHQYGASVDEARDKLEYDLFYIKNFSLSFDLLILFQTIKIVLFGRGAR